jgi:hypothetical protein
MEYLNKYIPKDYLALKINYCRKQLAMLPSVSVTDRGRNGIIRKKISVDNHVYSLDSKRGDEYYRIWLKRDEIERQLQIYEAIWGSHYKDSPLPECNPHKVKRTLNVDGENLTILNRAYFDSLKNDDNTKYPKNLYNFFDGIYYRSSVERDIAIFYTELGIPFKYEPSVMLAGLAKPINPDFVLYIEELDNCKFHEHFGMKDSSDYLSLTKVKFGNYANAGLVPNLDVLYTFDTEEFPFDIRYLSAMLNTSVYGTAIIHKPDANLPDNKNDN